MKKRKERASSWSPAFVLFFLSLLSLPGLGFGGEVMESEGRHSTRQLWGFEVIMA